MESSGKLAFRNEVQAVLFDVELSGQISDGQWENLAIEDHWLDWSRAEVIVDPSNLGRDFFAKYESYNFVAKDLLEVIGDRMLTYGRATKAFGRKFFDNDRMSILCENYGEVPSYWDEADRLKMNLHLNALGITIDDVKQVTKDAARFTMSDLLRELRDMKKIKKMRRA